VTIYGNGTEEEDRRMCAHMLMCVFVCVLCDQVCMCVAESTCV